MQTIAFANLEVTVRQEGGVVVYRFTGDVNESFEQEKVPRIKAASIILELEGINNFNSCGIREWIYFIKDLSLLGHLIFRGCSIAMVDQINMVPDCIANGEVESIYGPYFCERHGEINQLIVIKEQREFLDKNEAPPFECPHCHDRLEFDALEESYFLFLHENSIQNAS